MLYHCQVWAKSIIDEALELLVEAIIKSIGLQVRQLRRLQSGMVNIGLIRLLSQRKGVLLIDEYRLPQLVNGGR